MKCRSTQPIQNDRKYQYLPWKPRNKMCDATWLWHISKRAKKCWLITHNYSSLQNKKTFCPTNTNTIKY